jgi:hypothetical protein
MAHKTLVGGTAYEIKGGKTLVGSTAYEIKGGKTIVGGTAYGIPFSITVNITSFSNWISGESTTQGIIIDGVKYAKPHGELQVSTGTIAYCFATNGSIYRNIDEVIASETSESSPHEIVIEDGTTFLIDSAGSSSIYVLDPGKLAFSAPLASLAGSSRKTFLFEDGMTWGDFIASSYNTSGFYEQDGMPYTKVTFMSSTRTCVPKLNDVPVKVSDKIVPFEYYF